MSILGGANKDFAASFTTPARNGEAITPSDVAGLNRFTRGIYVGGTGDLVVTMAGNSASVAFRGVPAGTLLPIIVSRVSSASTTATNLVAVW